MACGIWGATGIKPQEAEHLNRYVGTILAQLEPDGTDFLTGLGKALENGGLIVAGIYLCGLTVIGIPLIAVLLFIRGFALGFTAGFFIAQKGWPGLLVSAAALLPQNLVLLPVLIVASALAVCFATILVRRLFNPRLAQAIPFARYSLLMGLATLVAIGGGLIEVFITPQLLAAVMTLLETK
jgi:stage II sporulation protein M